MIETILTHAVEVDHVEDHTPVLDRDRPDLGLGLGPDPDPEADLDHADAHRRAIDPNTRARGLTVLVRDPGQRVAGQGAARAHGPSDRNIAAGHGVSRAAENQNLNRELPLTKLGPGRGHNRKAKTVTVERRPKRPRILRLQPILYLDL